MSVSPRGSSSAHGYGGGGGGGGGRRAEKDTDRRSSRIDGDKRSGRDKAEDNRQIKNTSPRKASETSFDQGKRASSSRNETLDPVEHQSGREQDSPKNAGSHNVDDVRDGRNDRTPSSVRSRQRKRSSSTVSYTHLTLPTILRV